VSYLNDINFQIFKAGSGKYTMPIVDFLFANFPKNGSNSRSWTLGTSRTNFNIMWWHSVGYHEKPLPLRIHVPTEAELASPLSVICAGFYLSKMHAAQLPVHKIRACIPICVVEFVNYRCGIWMQMQKFCCIWRWLRRHSSLLYNLSRSFC
jgi:hypothetical protein